MDKLKWELLTEIQGRWEADIIKAYLASNEIDSELFQESVGSLYPTSLDMLGRVQIYVSKEDSKIAQQLLKEYYKTDEPHKAPKKTGGKLGAKAKNLPTISKHKNKR